MFGQTLIESITGGNSREGFLTIHVSNSCYHKVSVDSPFKQIIQECGLKSLIGYAGCRQLCFLLPHITRFFQ